MTFAPLFAEIHRAGVWLGVLLAIQVLALLIIAAALVNRWGCCGSNGIGFNNRGAGDEVIIVNENLNNGLVNNGLF